MKKNKHEQIKQNMERRIAKKSLRKKVRMAMTLSSSVSVAIISLLVMIMLFTVVKGITSVYVQYSVSQMALVISDEWNGDEEIDKTMIEHMVVSLANNDYLNIESHNGLKNDLSESEMSFFQSVSENLIHYKVVLVDEDGNEDVLFDTEGLDRYSVKDGNTKKFLGKFTSSATAEIYDFYGMAESLEKKDEDMMKSFIMDEMSGEMERLEGFRVGYVEAVLNPNLVYIFFGILIFFALVIFIINGIVTTMLRYILSGMITKPVAAIASQLKSIAEGDIESSMNSVVQVRRPVKEVQIMMDSTNRIIHKTKEYMETMEEQNFELEAQKEELMAQNGTLEDRSHALTSLNEAYLGRTLNFQNLLDNVGQGFMTIGSDLKINPEYSMACESMVHTEPECSDECSLEGQKITDVLSIEASDKQFVEELLEKVFVTEGEQRDLYITLLPEEMKVDGKIFHVEYKPVCGVKGEPQMLIITTDITEQRLLESRVEEERNILQMVVKVIMNRNEFNNLIEEFKEFTETDFVEAQQVAYEDTLRELHTLKGSFSQYYLNAITHYLNELEDAISLDTEVMKTIDSEKMLEVLNDELNTIKDYVSEDFFLADDIYTIKEQQIADLEFKLKDVLPDYEFNKVLPLIQSIRHKSVQELLSSYPDYTHKLSERLGKSVHDFEITGDEVYVDNAIYHKVFKTLVHVFRNAADHGIEDEEERLMFKKDPSASITCDIGDFGDYFRITIEDDGRGIEPTQIIERAKEKGFYQGEEGDEIYQLLFKDGFTTRESASAISGRGVGLAAVRYAVEELGGTIEITSSLGEGTKFIIKLPFVSDTSLISFTPDKLMVNVSKIVQEYFSSLGVSLLESDRFKSNKISLLRVNALISVKGAIEGIMFFSTNEILGRALTKAFIMDEIDETYITDYIEDVLGEITNTVLGNVLGALEEQGVYLTIGVPALISNKEAYMKYTESEILVTNYKNNDYELSLNLLVLDGNDDNTFITGR